MTDLTRYGFTSEHQQVHDTVDRYARERLHPLLPRMDDEDWFPEEEFRALAHIGILGITVPEAQGGAGLDLVAQGLAVEALAYWNHCLAACYLASDNLCVHNILRNASDEQRRRFLPRFCSGKAIGALGLTEPGAGSDALGLAATARREGNDYLINGRKLFITNGPVADLLLIYAKTAPEKGGQGISAFVVEKDSPGFSVAQKLKKMGWRGSPTGELVFDDCRVPASNRLGEENAGVAVMMSGLDIERVIIALYCVGVARRALDLAVDYARTRTQFGKPIGEFQLVQGMLADMATDVEAMRCLAYQLLREVNGLTEAEGGRGGIHQRSAAALLFAGRALMRVLDLGVQVHGGMGFMWETEINRLYRSGKLMEIGAGTTQIRQLIVAGELLKSM